MPNNEPTVKGSWPLVRLIDGVPHWYIAGTNPPQYARDEALERVWRERKAKKGKTMLTIHNCDNLEALRRFAANGERFDLTELDGPYGAGLEGWDILTEDQYLAHYADRLGLVRDTLQPWGVSFLFGYPEGCAEIKAWARQTNTLHLRRWTHWYNNQAAHAGRKVQVVMVFVPAVNLSLWREFQAWLTKRRRELKLTIVQCHQQTGIAPYARGGYIWFESESSSIPSYEDYATLKRFFDIPDYFDQLCDLRSFDGLTNLDFISVPVERAEQLNDNGLRSKPLGLYDTLFRPVIPPRDTKRALILYGGSGNAAIAAGKLGYDVDICETDPARCEMIRRRWAWQVERRDETPVAELGPLFNLESEPAHA